MRVAHDNKKAVSHFFQTVLEWRQSVRSTPVWACVLALVILVPLVFNLWYIEQYDTVKYGLTILLTAAAYWYVFRTGVWRVTASAGHYKKVILFVGLFLGWSLLATIFAFDHLYAVVGFYNRLSNSLLFHIAFVGVILLGVGFSVVQRRVLLQAATSVSILASVWSILQTVGFGYYDSNALLAWYRAPGLLGNPNFSSMYFVVLLPFALWFAAAEKTARARAWYGVGSFLLVLGIILSGSRGAMLALACVAVCGIGLVWYYRRPARKLLLIGVCFAVLAIGLNLWFTAATRPALWQQTVKLSDSNIQDRFAIWRVAALSISHRPWFGSGLGNALYAFENERGPELFTDAVYDDMHNFILEWGVTGGVPLMGFGLLLIGWAAYCGIRKARLGSSQDIALLLALGAWVVAAFFTPISIPNYLILAIVIGLLCTGSEDRIYTIPRYVRASGGAIAIILVVCALLFLTGELVSGSGVRAYREGSYEKSEHLLKWGTRLNPTNPYAVFFFAGATIQDRAPLERQKRVVQKMARLHPGYNRTTVWLAHLYALQFYQTPTAGAVHLVGDSLEAAVVHEPYVRQHRYLRSQYYVLVERNEDAKRELLSLVAQDPKYYYGWLLLAKVYQLEKDSPGFVRALAGAQKASRDDLIYQLLYRVRHEPDITKIPLDIPNLLGAL